VRTAGMTAVAVIGKAAIGHELPLRRHSKCHRRPAIATVLPQPVCPTTRCTFMLKPLQERRCGNT
jgi:hypothetical protein